jgi:hypothetical protein
MRLVVKETKSDTVSIEQIDTNLLYFSENNCGDIYKLHRIDNGWAFISMDDSDCWSSGNHGTEKEAILAEIRYGNVYEFNSLLEAIGWFNELDSCFVN